MCVSFVRFEEHENMDRRLRTNQDHREKRGEKKSGSRPISLLSHRLYRLHRSRLRLHPLTMQQPDTASARDAALLHLVFWGSLGARSLAALGGVCRHLRDDVRAAWGEQASMTVNWAVPAAGMQPLCSVLAQLNGALVIGSDTSSTNRAMAGTTMLLPQEASIRSLACLGGAYSLMLPASFATWQRLEAVAWRAASSAHFETAALVDLVATAPALRTLDVECGAFEVDADLLGALSRLCDKPTVMGVILRIADNSCGYPSWKALVAAHGFAGSTKLVVA